MNMSLRIQYSSSNLNYKLNLCTFLLFLLADIYLEFLLHNLSCTITTAVQEPLQEETYFFSEDDEAYLCIILPK